MARPSYADVLAFSQGSKRVGETARSAFLEGAKSVDFADWSLAASALKDLVAATVGAYGLAAAELGTQWYEYCRSGEFERGYTAIVGDIDLYGANSDAREAIDGLFSGNVDEGSLIYGLSEAVGNRTRRHVRDTVLENLDEDLKQAERSGDAEFMRRCGYARVTAGDPCAFCVLLASQGFVYKSERSATRAVNKHGDKYHPDCQCVAVPFSKAGEIDGYGDLLSQHERAYREADSLRRGGDLPDELRERIDAARAKHEARLAAGLTGMQWDPTLNENAIIMRWQNEGMR